MRHARLLQNAKLLVFIVMVSASMAHAQQKDGLSLLNVTTNGLSALEARGLEASVRTELAQLETNVSRKPIALTDVCLADPQCIASTLNTSQAAWGVTVLVTRVGPVVQVRCTLYDRDGNMSFVDENLLEASTLDQQPKMLSEKFTAHLKRQMTQDSQDSNPFTHEKDELPPQEDDNQEGGESEESSALGTAFSWGGGITMAGGATLILVGGAYATWHYIVASSPGSSGAAKEAAPTQFLIGVVGVGAGTLSGLVGSALVAAGVALNTTE